MGRKVLVDKKVLVDTKVPANNTEIIFFSNFLTSFGYVYIAKSTKGVYQISFPYAAEKNITHPPLFSKGLSKNIKFQRDDSFLRRETEILQKYFQGIQISFDFPLDLRQGTPFQKRVWKKLQEIPYGEHRSYKWVAEQIGQPQAARAVGMANNKNPLPPVIPCHRVIGSDGKLVGYASGLHIKRHLLEMEYQTMHNKCFGNYSCSGFMAEKAKIERFEERKTTYHEP